MFFFQVNVENVMKTFAENSKRATDVLLRVIPKLKDFDWAPRLKENAVISHYFNKNVDYFSSLCCLIVNYR